MQKFLTHIKEVDSSEVIGDFSGSPGTLACCFPILPSSRCSLFSRPLTVQDAAGTLAIMSESRSNKNLFFFFFKGVGVVTVSAIYKQLSHIFAYISFGQTYIQGKLRNVVLYSGQQCDHIIIMIVLLRKRILVLTQAASRFWHLV